MLSLLHIENVAVVELCDIIFDSRLNVLTGETGAGKSIIIDSLSALIGKRTSRDLIRSGADKALVSGVFIAQDEQEILIEREIQRERSVCRLDKKPATLSVLRETCESLVNIHGQHDSSNLLREETHIEYLDTFAKVSLDVYAELYSKHKALRAERSKAALAGDEKDAKITLLTNRLSEIRELNIMPGEEDALNLRRETLLNAWQITENLGFAHASLGGEDGSDGACRLVSLATKALEKASRASPELEVLCERLNELEVSLEDCALEIRGFCRDMEDSQDELERIETRLDALNKLRRKHNMELSKILELFGKWEAELHDLESGDERLQELDHEIASVEAALLAEAGNITAIRKRAAEKLEVLINAELCGLDMPRAKFEAALKPAKPQANGCDDVVFEISANIGEPLKPLAKVASGGEMSRIMLALTNVITSGGTLVFDEVDSGVSGEAAQKIAQKLCEVSRRTQVLSVTHLPQVAAFADTHFRVEKEVIAGRTLTKVIKLNREERIEELARLTVGENITEAAKKAAEEMLDKAAELRCQASSHSRTVV